MESLQIGMSPDELRRWAAAHGVSHWLQLPARVLQGHLKGAWFWMYRNKSLTLEEILTLPTARGAYEASETHMPRELQDAAAELLKEQAGMLEQGLLDESGLLASLHPPLDHRLRPLWEQLMAVRKEIRSHTHPRAYRQQGPVELTLQEDPPLLRYREQTQGWCGDDGYYPEVHIDLQPHADRAPVRCRCNTGNATKCAIGLSAVDAALNVLCDSRQPQLRERIAKLIHEPGWSRTLEALDRVLLSSESSRIERPEEEALGWRIRHQPGQPLELQPVRCRPLRTGAGLKSWKIDVDALLQDPSLCNLPVDRDVLAQLHPAPEVSARSQPKSLRQALVHRAISLLISHPRVLLDRGNQPITVRRGQLSLAWQQEHALEPIRLQPTINGETISISTLLDGLDSQLAGGFWIQVVDASTIRVISVAAGAVALFENLLSRGSTFPAEAADALIERRAAFERLLPVSLDPPLRGRQLPPNTAPVIRLQTMDEEVLRIRILVRPLAEGGVYPPGQGPQEVYGERAGQRVFTRRVWPQERKDIQQAMQRCALPAPDNDDAFQWTLTDPATALSVLETVTEAGWETLWSGPPRRLSDPITADCLQMTITSSRDWLGLNGVLTIDGVNVPLADVLEAVWEGRPFLVVDGTWVRLEAGFRERLTQAAAAIYAGRKGLEISPLSAPCLQALVEHGAVLKAPDKWSQITDNIAQAMALQPTVPSGLSVTLRDYQLAGFTWMTRLAAWGAGGILADDMGLGKTVQSLAMLLNRSHHGPALVVAPTSVCFNWQRESVRVAPRLRPIRYQGNGRRRLLASLQSGDVLIVSYGLMRRDVEWLKKYRFGTVIFDEAQALKNPAAERTRAARLIQGDFRLALSGTPVENRVSELWSLFSVISPGLLGSRDRFRSRFVGPIERGDRQAQHGLGSLMRPFLLRRLKANVANELPPRTDILEEIPLSEAELVLYEKLRMASLAALTDPERKQSTDNRFQILAAITRLRQQACHPQLTDPNTAVESSKMRRLRSLVACLRAEGHRALIFSQFTAHLQLARSALTADGVTGCYLDGSTPTHRRQEQVERFQAGEGDVFYISLKAGGTGLNLTSATFVIHLDPWWNPAIEDQATDRAHRIGQRQPVTVYRLISRGTIEESILELHREKRALVEALLGGTAAAGTASPEHLLSLIEQSRNALSTAKDSPDEEE